MLGFGTLWNTGDFPSLGIDVVVEDEIYQGLSVFPSNTPKYVGHAGRFEYDALGGSGDLLAEDGTFNGLSSAQIIAGNGRGSIDSHWLESEFQNELMTPAIGLGSNPLSLMSLRSLEDLGYAVDPSSADAFTLPLLSASIVSQEASKKYSMHGDSIRPSDQVIMKGMEMAKQRAKARGRLGGPTSVFGTP